MEMALGRPPFLCCSHPPIPAAGILYPSCLPTLSQPRVPKSCYTSPCCPADAANTFLEQKHHPSSTPHLPVSPPGTAACPPQSPHPSGSPTPFTLCSLPPGPCLLPQPDCTHLPLLLNPFFAIWIPPSVWTPPPQTLPIWLSPAHPPSLMHSFSREVPVTPRLAQMPSDLFWKHLLLSSKP